MTSRGYVFGLVVSLSLHGLLFAMWRTYEGPRVLFERGAAAVTLNIMPSVASRAGMPKAAGRPVPEAEPEPLVEVEVAPEENEVPEPERPVEAAPEPPAPEPPLPEPRPEPTLRPIEEPPAPAEPRAASLEQARAVSPRQEPLAEPSKEHANGAARSGTPGGEAQPREGPPGPDAQVAGQSGVPSVASVDANADLAQKGVNAPASAVNVPRPTYPLYSRRYGEEGRAVLLVEIRADGSAGKVEVVQSSGYRRLDEVALRALRRATFIPAKVGGRPVASQQRIAFVFRLEDAAAR